MDQIFLEAVTMELEQRLAGAAVSKVHQTGERDLLLRLWTGRENLRLLVSADPRTPRLHLTAARPPNPGAPPRFCQLLRARLLRLQHVERLPGERIVRLAFSGPEGSRWDLVAELLGPHANLLLLDAGGRIVDALVRSDAARPGTPWSCPPPPPRQDLAAGVPAIPADRPLAAWLRETLSPMTVLAVADLVATVAGGADPRQALEDFRRRWLAREFAPGTGTWQGRPVLFALPPATLELAGRRDYPGPSAAADAFYGNQAGGRLFGGGREELERLVKKAVARLEKRLRHIAAEEVKAAGAERQRQLGDLLLANLHRLRRGMGEVVLDDWFAEPPEPVRIELDPALSPQENAEARFRRHRKGKRAREHIDRRRAETLAELDWLGGVALALEELEDPADLESLREELAGAGLLARRPEPGRPPSARTARDQLHSARSPHGFQLFWGRNNRSNDHVSRQLTGPDDLWFHAHNLPGCHLVLKREPRGAAVPEEDFRYAAALAAGYSRGKAAAKVEVMVAAGRQVRKPKGARPGLVTVAEYRTVLVAPRRLGAGEGREG